MKAALRVMTSAAALCLGAFISCGSATAAELTLVSDLQKIIAYSAGVPTKAKEADAAKAFVKFLSSEAAVSVVKKMGMDPAQ